MYWLLWQTEQIKQDCRSVGCLLNADSFIYFQGYCYYEILWYSGMLSFLVEILSQWWIHRGATIRSRDRSLIMSTYSADCLLMADSICTYFLYFPEYYDIFYMTLGHHVLTLASLFSQGWINREQSEVGIDQTVIFWLLTHAFNVILIWNDTCPYI